MLKLLHFYKKGKRKPFIRLYNVISKLNYNNISKMIDFALKTYANFIEFQIIDIVKGKTDELALSEQEKNMIVKQFEVLKTKENYFTGFIGEKHLSHLKSHQKQELTEFGRFRFPLPYGFKIGNNYDYLICPQGIRSDWNSKRYKEFRRYAKKYKKSHLYFSKINCYKSCDNLGMNLEFYRRLKALKWNKKVLYKLVGYFKNESFV